MNGSARQLIWLVLAILASLSILAACRSGDEAATPTPSAAAFPLQVTDDAGQTLTLVKPPTAIASLSAGHTEILYAIGAGDQVIAVDKTSDYPAKTAGLPKVDAFSPSLEAITILQPDLVIIFFDP